MCDRTDLELRVYLTGRPDGTIEWQVTAVLDDGQVEWQDGAVSGWKPGRPVTPRDLSRVVSQTLRHLCYQLRA